MPRDIIDAPDFHNPIDEHLACARPALRGTLLRKSADERISPFHRQIYPTAFVTGMPRAV
jgi:hypothetical protein